MPETTFTMPKISFLIQIWNLQNINDMKFTYVTKLDENSQKEQLYIWQNLTALFISIRMPKRDITLWGLAAQTDASGAMMSRRDNGFTSLTGNIHWIHFNYWKCIIKLYYLWDIFLTNISIKKITCKIALPLEFGFNNYFSQAGYCCYIAVWHKLHSRHNILCHEVEMHKLKVTKENKTYCTLTYQTQNTGQASYSEWGQ